MAERRMFSKQIIDSDAFLEMPISSRLLYYDLNMRADDDGFVNSPKKIMKITGASNDDMNILITRKFIIPFDTGVVVIKHWRIHNYIRKDRYVETNYKEEKSQLLLDENKAYTLKKDDGIPLVDQGLTQDRIGKDRIGKDNIINDADEIIQKSFIECLGSTNTYSLNECISYLEDMDAELIIYALKKTAGIKNPNWNYCKTILDSYIKNNITSIETLDAVNKSKEPKKETLEEEAERLKEKWGITDED